MNPRSILEDFSALPPEAQREAADFIDFLKTRYTTNIDKVKEDLKIPLAKELFIGMWRQREEMEESTQWVTSLRAREWK